MTNIEIPRSFIPSFTKAPIIPRGTTPIPKNNNPTIKPNQLKAAKETAAPRNHVVAPIRKEAIMKPIPENFLVFRQKAKGRNINSTIIKAIHENGIRNV